MARGKQTCKILKEIRRQIAEANDIEFVTSECRYKGDCLGTCPKCEVEVRYLEQRLRERQIMGKAVVLAGLSAGMLTFSGCGSSSNRTADDSDTMQVTPVEVFEGGIDDIPEPGEILEELPPSPDDNCVYEMVEKQPEFPGGTKAMFDFIAQNLKYPKEQLEAGIQGRVLVQFYVDSLGNVCEPTILRGKDPALDQEAIRLVKTFPRFSPGMLNGKKVKVRYLLPITFKLPEE